MRCFVAVDASEGVAKKITELQKQLHGTDIKLVEPENLHFTMKFLGEVDVKTLCEVSSRLKNVAGNTKAFDVDVEGVGAFPDEKFIRVVWIGCQKLVPLQVAINKALSPLDAEEKLSPHLTLGRVRSQNLAIPDFIKANKKYRAGTMKIDRIKLKKSTLMREGPIYEDIEVFELRK